ncbi:hypothetical protein QFC21_005114 [Naganishia friedmannii]|uniref:Uncharacterized protein n=1 Tax=Naganishia friedmannii TaxID=89922 RepID=A0ACC2VDB3_9TREE|nr:hypothetical protein QFC21_005114 [Naganishia friedmannii]
MNSLSGGSVKPESVDSGQTLDNTLAATPFSGVQSNVTHPNPFEAGIRKLFKELSPRMAGSKAEWMEVEGRKYILCLPTAKASSRVLADIWRTWSAAAWATQVHLMIRSIRWRFEGIINFLECTYGMSSAGVKRLYTQQAGPFDRVSALVMPARELVAEHSVSDSCKTQQADYVTRLLSIISGNAFQNKLHKRTCQDRAKYLGKTDKLLQLMRSAILEVDAGRNVGVSKPATYA